MDNNQAPKETIETPQEKNTRETRERRHFDYLFKKKVVADVLAGRVAIDQVKDKQGKTISRYLVDRWKTELRGQKFAADALETAYTPSIKKPEGVQIHQPVNEELIRLRSENARLKTILAVDFGLDKVALPYFKEASKS